MPLNLHLHWKPLIQQKLLAYRSSQEEENTSVSCTDTDVDCELSDLHTLTGRSWFDQLPYLSDRGYVDGTVYLVEATLWEAASWTKVMAASFALPSLAPDAATMEFDARWEDAVNAFIVQRIDASRAYKRGWSISVVNAGRFACRGHNIRKCVSTDASDSGEIPIYFDGREEMDNECGMILNASDDASDILETPSSENMAFSSDSSPSIQHATPGEGEELGHYADSYTDSVVTNHGAANSKSKPSWEEVKKEMKSFNWADEVDDEDEEFSAPLLPPQPPQTSQYGGDTPINGHDDETSYYEPEASHEEYATTTTEEASAFATQEELQFMEWHEMLGNAEIAKQSYYVHQSDGEIHHFNYQGEPVEVESRTRPEESFAVLWCGPKILYDASHGDDFTRESVIRAGAMKYIDPVIFRGQTSLLPHCETASEAMCVAENSTRKFYTPMGNWMGEVFQEMEHVPEADCCDPTSYQLDADEIVVNGWFKTQLTREQPATLRDGYHNAFWNAQKVGSKRNFIPKPSPLRFCESVTYDSDEEENRHGVQKSTVAITPPCLRLEIPSPQTVTSPCPGLLELDEFSPTSEYSTDELLNDIPLYSTRYVTGKRSCSEPTLPIAPQHDVDKLTRAASCGNLRLSVRWDLTCDEDNSIPKYDSYTDADDAEITLSTVTGRETRSAPYSHRDYDDCVATINYDADDDDDDELTEPGEDGYASASTETEDTVPSPPTEQITDDKTHPSLPFLIHPKVGLLPQLMTEYPLSITRSLRRQRQPPAVSPKPHVIAVKPKISRDVSISRPPPQQQVGAEAEQTQAADPDSKQSVWSPYWAVFAGFFFQGVFTLAMGRPLLS
ncbi:hypothetical protein KEM56_001844 [Ascosphaera pollenicola]|nr:hypothetical protein KEM56_001844 [Ascosphaera pollenicola]